MSITLMVTVALVFFLVLRGGGVGEIFNKEEHIEAYQIAQPLAGPKALLQTPLPTVTLNEITYVDLTIADLIVLSAEAEDFSILEQTLETLFAQTTSYYSVTVSPQEDQDNRLLFTHRSGWATSQRNIPVQTFMVPSHKSLLSVGIRITEGHSLADGYQTGQTPGWQGRII